MTKPTTEELKDLLGKVTQGEWAADHTYQWPGKIRAADSGRFICNSDPHVKDEQFGGIGQNRANATLIALAPTLAAEVVELRGLLWYAWREFNAIRARSGAPLTHDGMTTVAEEWWDQMTEAFEEAIGEDAAKPWPSPEARQALSQK